MGRPPPYNQVLEINLVLPLINIVFLLNKLLGKLCILFFGKEKFPLT